MRGAHREPRTAVGKILREYRIRNRLNMRELGDRLDVTIQHISNIEGGLTPIPFHYYSRLMRILSVPADEFLDALKKDLEDKFYEAIKENRY